MTLRVAYVINTLEVGGAERLLVELARRLDRARFSPQVYTVLGGGPLADDLRSGNVPVEHVRRRLRFGPDVIVHLAAVFRRAGTHIVHTHLRGAALYGTVAALVARVPVIVTTRHSALEWAEGPLARRVRRIVEKRIGATIAVSESVAARLAGDGMPRTRIRVILNGVDTTRFRPVTQARTGIRRAAMIGRLDHPKGHAIALQALALLRQSGRTLPLEVIGDGVLREDLIARARAAKLDDVTFHGQRADIERVLAGVDVVLMPSLVEGLPLSLLEAMAAGKLLIASEVGGIPEVITDGVDGILVPPGDAQALAEALRQSMDAPAESARIRSAARDTILRAFDINATVRAHQILYEELWRDAHARAHR